ncbi:uncharacterized protein EI90DRAFT_221818 [Cantharellus anzutake]|uniref:uncharacterized protein n=1 Tax=Cantharellus anzutake TaxID=1750568 RepID=UPI00190463F2|nr:uncharacterized protein EI90DRAFT_221818 [Cantharellus anzutake]KAF8316945.1 hypothetical protein EI90DRAFT_221818 [Cantharellus anzutake]
MGNTHDERPCENEGVAPEFNFDLPQDPGLKEIPVRYVVHQLNQLAPLYWNRPQVATCAVLIPQPIQVEVPPPETRRGSYAGIIPDARRRISAPTPSIFQRTQSRVLLLHSEFLLPSPRYFVHSLLPHLIFLSSCHPSPPSSILHGRLSAGLPAVLLAS